jgi:hypothetical protein
VLGWLNDTYNNQKVGNVHENRGVGQPTDFAQAANDTRNHADAKNDNHDCREADMSLGDLRDVGRFAQNQNGYSQKLLKRLRDVDEVTRAFAEETEEGVAVTHHGVARRVEIHEDFPDGPAGEGGEDAEDEVECDTGAVSDTGEDEAGTGTVSRCMIDRGVPGKNDLRSTRPTKNVSGNKEEHLTPAGSSHCAGRATPFRVGGLERISESLFGCRRVSSECSGSSLFVDEGCWGRLERCLECHGTLLLQPLLAGSTFGGELVLDQVDKRVFSMLEIELGGFLPLHLAFNLGPVDIFFPGDGLIDTGCKTPDTFLDDLLLAVATDRRLACLRVDGHFRRIGAVIDGVDRVGVHGDRVSQGLGRCGVVLD